MLLYVLLSVTCTLFSGQSSIKDRLNSMPLEQKIGQLFMVAAVSDASLNATYIKETCYSVEEKYVNRLIKDYHVGGIIFLGVATKESIQKSVSKYQQISDIPLLIGLDAEWGVGMRVKDGRSFEKNNLLGLRTNEEIESIGAAIGADCKELGVHINFAPVVDVNTNPNNPIIGARSFGNDPYFVAEKAIAYMHGLQSVGILACAKHFPGHGDTDVDSHFELPVLRHDRDRLHAVELLPFKKMIAAGVDAIMIAHLSVPALDPTGVPASFSRVIIDVLRRCINFEGLAISDVLGHPTLTKQFPEVFAGLIITDALDMRALTNHCEPGEIELFALLAGNDILLCPVDVPKAVEKIRLAVRDGKLREQELDEHVERILLVKATLGLI